MKRIITMLLLVSFLIPKRVEAKELGCYPQAGYPIIKGYTREKEVYKKIRAQKRKEKEGFKKDLYVMAHVINAEAGATYHSDKHRRYVGSVVLNRVKNKHFPNTIRGVVFQRGQYGCINNGMYYRKPSRKCWKIAKRLLRKGSVLPSYVIFQDNKPHGTHIYEKVDDDYFCY